MQLLVPGKGWARGSNGRLFWTDDDGAHWTNISPNTTSYMTDIFFLDVSHGWVLLTRIDEEKNLAAFAIASTSDSGRTWTFSPLAVPAQKPDELDGHAWLDFADPMHGWAVLHARSSSAFSWGLLLATDDGGKTWTELPHAPIASRPTFFTPRDGWLSGPAWAGRFSTHDGGRSWQGGGGPADLPEAVLTHVSYGEIKFTSPKHGFLPIWLAPSNDEHRSRGTDLILYVTDDGGQTWRRDKALTDSDLGPIDYVKDIITLPGTDESVLIAAINDKTNRLTLITAGRERAVTRLNSTLPLREHDYIVQFDFADSIHGWAFTRMGSLLSTTDSGAIWNDQSPEPTPHLESMITKKNALELDYLARPFAGAAVL